MLNQKNLRILGALGAIYYFYMKKPKAIMTIDNFNDQNVTALAGFGRRY